MPANLLLELIQAIKQHIRRRRAARYVDVHRHHLIDALDDPYLLNRQFAFKGLQEMLGPQLGETDYRFYMTPEERRQPLAALRARLSDTRSRRP